MNQKDTLKCQKTVYYFLKYPQEIQTNTEESF